MPPTCISDAIRRLVVKGLLEYCKASFAFKFQKANPRALKFGANLDSGATHMFHLISGVMHQASEHEDDEKPLAIASLDVTHTTF